MSDRDRDYYWEQVRQQNRQKPPEEPKRSWRMLAKPLLWLLIPLLLAAGTGLWRHPASHAWLQERWVLLQARLGMATGGTPSAPVASPYSDSPRTLADCIKPGNVIDDEVRACVKGYRPKTW